MKTYTLRLTEDDIDNMLMSMRYCELHHPKEDEKKLIRNSADEIYRQLKTTELFNHD